METLTLESGRSRLVLQPETGGTISRYSSERELEIFDWMRPAGEKGKNGEKGSEPMEQDICSTQPLSHADGSADFY